MKGNGKAALQNVTIRRGRMSLCCGGGSTEGEIARCYRSLKGRYSDLHLPPFMSSASPGLDQSILARKIQLDLRNNTDSSTTRFTPREN